jgi:UDP-N-acetylglucosamine 2-epimerase (non-hydrolysing)
VRSGCEPAMRHIDCVIGARPNFMKAAPLLRALEASGVAVCLVHTGQHYDRSMSEVFLEQLGVRTPDVQLNVGSGTHGQQTARILERYEAHLLQTRPAGVVVVGDVNSTLACSLAAVKLPIPVAHVEAGLRSYDRRMPEEINRIVTDALADVLLVTEASGRENLVREGIDPARIHEVGNLMIDTLLHELPHARSLGMPSRFGLEAGGFGLVTLHRPSNVDDAGVLGTLADLLRELARTLALVFPVHPRTRTRLEAAGLWHDLVRAPGLMITEPLGYRENLGLMAAARVVLTDSGGIQEETSFLGIPCLTLRDTTERPITVTVGTSTLVGNDPATIRGQFLDVVEGRYKPGTPIPLWDGHAAERAAAVLRESWGLLAPSPPPPEGHPMPAAAMARR